MFPGTKVVWWATKVLFWNLDKFSTLVGEIAWKLYDTYGFPADLTSLMVEEKGFSVDTTAYEKARKIAQVLFFGCFILKSHRRWLSCVLQEISQAKGDVTSDFSKLDVHSISELQSKNIPPTNDSPKYNYKAASDEGDGNYCKVRISVRCH